VLQIDVDVDALQPKSMADFLADDDSDSDYNVEDPFDQQGATDADLGSDEAADSEAGTDSVSGSDEDMDVEDD
jgi:hypothetical protein